MRRNKKALRLLGGLSTFHGLPLPPTKPEEICSRTLSLLLCLSVGSGKFTSMVVSGGGRFGRIHLELSQALHGDLLFISKNSDPII